MNPEATFILVLTLWLLYFVVLPAATYLGYEPRHRHVWRRQWLVEVPEHAPGGAFRDQDGEDASTHYLTEQRGAPREVKVVAVVSLVLGHMFVPGLLMGLFGLLFMFIGLVAIPGLILAVGIYRNAFGLLRCEPEAAVEARRLRRFAIWLNWTVMFVVSIVTMATPELYPLWLFFTAYAVISLAHARGLGHAADAIDAVHRGVVMVPTTSASRADYAASMPSSRGPGAARWPAPSSLDR